MLLENTHKTLNPVLKLKRYVHKSLMFIEACKYMDLGVWNLESGNKKISQALISKNPQAIGKLGSTELNALRSYLNYRHQKDWEERTAYSQKELYSFSGVYPLDAQIFKKYCEYMLEEVLPEMTILAVWFKPREADIVKHYAASAIRIPIRSLDMFYVQHDRWTLNLQNKTILIMHPFYNSVRMQYEKRRQIWAGQEDILPEFNLVQIKVPHYPELVPPSHPDWFASLNAMKQQMTDMHFDIALIGAGAYSLPLAVHAKKLGRVGIHLGGAAQVLFGIKGRRWDDHPVVSKFYNDAWIRPLKEDTPDNNSKIEGGCYW